jgi:hypothetical protein
VVLHGFLEHLFTTHSSIGILRRKKLIKFIPVAVLIKNLLAASIADLNFLIK